MPHRKFSQTPTASQIALQDLLLMYDIDETVSSNIIKRITPENILKIIILLTALAAPAAADLIPIYDTGTGTVKKITPENLLKVINGLTGLATPAATDLIPIYDFDVGAVRKITPQNLLKVINGLTTLASPVPADLVAIYDADTGEVKKLQLGSVPVNAHAALHQSGGSDLIKLDDLGATDDNTDLNASTSKHGLLPKLGGGTTNFLRADGTWGIPTATQPADNCAFKLVNIGNQLNIAIDTDVTVIFGTEVYDLGDDVVSNIFTAPVTAKYHLNALIQCGSIPINATYFRIKIITSNETYENIFKPDVQFSTTQGSWCGVISMLCDMDANDTAYVTVYQTNGTQQADLAGQSCHFSGFRVTN